MRRSPWLYWLPLVLLYLALAWLAAENMTLEFELERVKAVCP